MKPKIPTKAELYQRIESLECRLEYERSRADGNYHSYERIKDKYGGSVNVVKELKRRLDRCICEEGHFSPMECPVHKPRVETKDGR